MWGAGTSGGGCQAAGASDVDVQVGGALHQKMRLVGGEIERVSKMNGYGWGGGRKEGEKNDPENGRRKMWGKRARLKSNNKRQSLRLK